MEITRTIDKLGRIVLPMDFRKQLNLEGQVDVTISLSGNAMVVKGLEGACKICGSIKDVTDMRVCSECIRRIKKMDN